jgi:hypothetical protein
MRPVNIKHTCFRMPSFFFPISEGSLASMVLLRRWSPSLNQRALQATYPATMMEKKTKINRKGHMVHPDILFAGCSREIKLHETQTP